MGLDIGVWRVDGGVRRLVGSGMPTEERLEDLIEADPLVLGEPMLILGRQVITSTGKRLDLLAMDAEGALNILELKRDKTPRDVVAQALDYGSWAQTIDRDELLAIFAAYRPGVALEVAYQEVFGAASQLPEELNTGHRLTIVAGDIDTESERIIAYLADTYGVPINVLFFRYFADEGREYVARTWLLTQVQEAAPVGPSRTTRGPRGGGQKEPWNGTDWYLCFGHHPGVGRKWDDGKRLGFVSAGGGDWYSRTLRGVPVGARGWVYLPQTGYVAVGEVTGEAVEFKDSQFADAPGLIGEYGEGEWVLPMKWITVMADGAAVSAKGLFANQNSACKLRNSFTLEHLSEAFQLTL